MPSDPSSLPPSLRAVVEEFQRAPTPLKLPLLLDYAKKLPALEGAARADATRRFERVEECQTPLYVAADTTDGRVTLFFDAPEEAPTTRGFASILYHGLNGTTPRDVAAVPADLSASLGLTTLVSPLRLRGMDGMIRRVKSLVIDHEDATGLA